MLLKSIFTLAALAGIAFASPKPSKPYHPVPKQGNHFNRARQTVDSAGHNNTQAPACDPKMVLYAKTYVLSKYTYDPYETKDERSVLQTMSYYDPEEFHKLDGIEWCISTTFVAPTPGYESVWEQEAIIIRNGRPASLPPNVLDEIRGSGLPDKLDDLAEMVSARSKVSCAILRERAYFHLLHYVDEFSISASPFCAE